MLSADRIHIGKTAQLWLIFPQDPTRARQDKNRFAQTRSAPEEQEDQIFADQRCQMNAELKLDCIKLLPARAPRPPATSPILNIHSLHNFAAPGPIQAFYPATNPGPGPAAPPTVAAAQVSVNTACNTSMTWVRSVNSNNPTAPASGLVPVQIVLFALKVNRIHMHMHGIETSLVCSPYGQPRWSAHQVALLQEQKGVACYPAAAARGRTIL
jgi:hypothetical protein